MLFLKCLIVILLLISITCTAAQASERYPPVEVASFKRINFNFRTQQEEKVYLENEHYRNCTIAGVKLDKHGNIYVSLPRWKANVPATLAKVVTVNGETLLEPFPNWQMNTLNQPSPDSLTLYSVLGFEIDSNLNKMYIIDQGKVDNQPAAEGEIKFIIYDIESNMVETVIRFPPEIASPTNSFLNDVVIDDEDGMAYITDSGIPIDPTAEQLRPGLIVLNYHLSVAIRLLDSHPSMLNENIWIEVDNKRCLKDSPMITGADGIALSCDYQTLYWTPLTSRTLYAINTDLVNALINITDPEYTIDMVNKELSANIVNLGYKRSASDGLACSAHGKLYITAIEQNKIYSVDEAELAPYLSQSQLISNGTLASIMDTVVEGNANMIWPDTIGFSPDGYIYFVTNNLCAFVQDEIDYSNADAVNFRVWRQYVSDVSYLDGCHDHRPQPNIPFTIAELVATSASALVVVLALGITISCVAKKVLGRRRNRAFTNRVIRPANYESLN